MAAYNLLFMLSVLVVNIVGGQKKKSTCLEAALCFHSGIRQCGLETYTREIRWFLNKCDILEFNCEYKTRYLLTMQLEYPLYGLVTGSVVDNRILCKHRLKSKLGMAVGILVSDIMVSAGLFSAVLLIVFVTPLLKAHGPPLDRDNEDIAIGRKMGAKWCSMAKVCNHDRVPICGVSHAGDVMGFRDLCDMFDYNCIRRRNYKQTACPEDKSILTVSRRPTNGYYED